MSSRSSAAVACAAGSGRAGGGFWASASSASIRWARVWSTKRAGRGGSRGTLGGTGARGRAGAGSSPGRCSGTTRAACMAAARCWASSTVRRIRASSRSRSPIRACEDPALVVGGSAPVAELLLDLGTERALGVDVLVGEPRPAVALGDHLGQPLGLGSCPRELLVDLADAGHELGHGGLGLGRAPPRALGGELGASELPGLEQIGSGRFRSPVYRSRPAARPRRAVAPPPSARRTVAPPPPAPVPPRPGAAPSSRRAGGRSCPAAAAPAPPAPRSSCATSPAPRPSATAAQASRRTAAGRCRSRPRASPGRGARDAGDATVRSREPSRCARHRSRTPPPRCQAPTADRSSPGTVRPRADENLPSRGATGPERGSVGINWRRIAAERQLRHRQAPRRRSPQARASEEPRASAGGSTTCRLARPHIQELCNPLG